jgi:hypothetical protein
MCFLTLFFRDENERRQDKKQLYEDNLSTFSEFPFERDGKLGANFKRIMKKKVNIVKELALTEQHVPGLALKTI